MLPVSIKQLCTLIASTLILFCYAKNINILSILKPVYRQLQQIHYTYESLMSLDLHIWQFFVDDDDNNYSNNDNDTIDYFTPCTFAWGKI